MLEEVLEQSAVDRLRKADGAEFDRAFAARMVQDHEEAVNLFRQALLRKTM